ncbi:MAG TPA: hypothetical protein VK787_06640 [Puia sp.]|jgi:hypothetical protein|nr:hypothetical protein [Puia sp.]
MESVKGNVMIIIAHDEWILLLEKQDEIIELLREKNFASAKPGVRSPYITAKEFMSAVRICRSNFDKLVKAKKIMTLKKGRKVYVVAGEVERYFREVV